MAILLKISKDHNGVPVLERASKAISSIESEGSGGYQAIGPITKSGDRAYGRYQVMGANIPAWTQEVLGRSMTPQEFLKDQAAQDKVFKAKFGQYIEQTGNVSDAASMWFSGKPLALARGRSDILGTTAQEYVNKFNRSFGGDDTPSVAAVPGSLPSMAGPSDAPGLPHSGRSVLSSWGQAIGDTLQSKPELPALQMSPPTGGFGQLPISNTAAPPSAREPGLGELAAQFGMTTEQLLEMIGRGNGWS